MKHYAGMGAWHQKHKYCVSAVLAVKGCAHEFPSSPLSEGKNESYALWFSVCLCLCALFSSPLLPALAHVFWNINLDQQFAHPKNNGKETRVGGKERGFTVPRLARGGSLSSRSPCCPCRCLAVKRDHGNQPFDSQFHTVPYNQFFLVRLSLDLLLSRSKMRKLSLIFQMLHINDKALAWTM